MTATRSLYTVSAGRLTGDNVYMQAAVEPPDAILRQLEILAKREGATPDDLILRLVEAHVEQCSPPLQSTSKSDCLSSQLPKLDRSSL